MRWVVKIPSLGRFLLILVIFLVTPVFGQTFHYTVEIEAPVALRDLMKNNLDVVRWRDNSRMDLPKLRSILRRTPEQAMTLLETQGYYSPEIKTQLDTSGVDPVARIRIQAGDLSYVKHAELDFKGACDAKRGAILRKRWRVAVGEPFNQAAWEDAKSRILLLAGSRITPYAKFEHTEAKVDPSTHQVQLFATIDCGPAIIFGQLKIEGLHFFDPKFVENLNPITVGEPYDDAALQLLQTRLQDSGYFSNVLVRLASGQTGDTRDVRVSLTENKRKKLGIGLGYSTNTLSRGQLSFDDLDLLGLRFSSQLLMETFQQKAQANFYWPTTARGLRDNLGAKYERKTLQGETTAAFSVALGRTWGKPWFEQNINFQVITESRALPSAPSTRSKSLPFTYGISLKRTNDLFFPSDGYQFDVQTSMAVKKLFTDRSFFRAKAKLAKYISFGKRNIFKLRAELGVVGANSSVGIPEDFLFRAGGDQSVRGYAYQSLGVAKGGAIVGGRYLATASFEAQHWFSKNWGGAIFYDTGNATDSLLDFRFDAGYGVGLRWKSPVGPINFDVAYGQAVSEYRLHFSLGANF